MKTCTGGAVPIMNQYDRKLQERRTLHSDSHCFLWLTASLSRAWRSLTCASAPWSRLSAVFSSRSFAVYLQHQWPCHMRTLQHGVSILLTDLLEVNKYEFGSFHVKSITFWPFLHHPTPNLIKFSTIVGSRVYQNKNLGQVSFKIYNMSSH